jgi:hypothetical protein
MIGWISQESPWLFLCFLSLLIRKYVYSVGFNVSEVTEPRPLLFHIAASPTTPERPTIQYSRSQFKDCVLCDYRSLRANLKRWTCRKSSSEEQSHNKDFKKVDIQYINKLAIFHGRNSYIENPENR